jgi:hypothetical protein
VSNASRTREKTADAGGSFRGRCHFANDVTEIAVASTMIDSNWKVMNGEE